MVFTWMVKKCVDNKSFFTESSLSPQMCRVLSMDITATKRFIMVYLVCIRGKQ